MHFMKSKLLKPNKYYSFSKHDCFEKQGHNLLNVLSLARASTRTTLEESSRFAGKSWTSENFLKEEKQNSNTLDKPRVKYIKDIYDLETYRRSNQDTCLKHKPALTTGEWVESGDLIADNTASMNGELAIGKNILVAYMPWEGYNYEDSILINERLVYDDAYTSVHIERYEMEIREGQQGSEQITKDIPDLNPEELAHLDNTGIAKIGSWIEEGDILVGKVTPINPKKQTGYQRLILKLFDKKAATVRDSSLRAPKGMKASVINVHILDYVSQMAEQKTVSKKTGVVNIHNDKKVTEKAKLAAKGSSQRTVQQKVHNTNLGDLTPWLQPKGLSQQNASNNKPLSVRKYQLNHDVLNSSYAQRTVTKLLKGKANPNTNSGAKYPIPECLSKVTKMEHYYYNNGYTVSSNLLLLRSNSNSQPQKTQMGQNKLVQTNSKHQISEIKQKLMPTTVHIYLAETRKIQVGDKMAGRHGNKGIISNILPRQDMPYLPDGTPLDIVLNPLGVPSRMNVGQIYECLLGLAGKFLGEHYKVFPFDELYGAEASRSFVFGKLFEARKKTGIDWLFNPDSPGKIRIFDGRTDESFDQPVTVGIAYMLKLVHMVDDKIHARSTGPYSLVTQQPLRGRAKQGGQRLGEMEVWAIEGYGAAFVLLEMLTLKSDDMTGRLKLWSDLILNNDITLGTPESFKVLVCELQALCLDIGLFTKAGWRGDSGRNSLEQNKVSSQREALAVGSPRAASKESPSQKRVFLKKRRYGFKQISHLMFMP